MEGRRARRRHDTAFLGLIAALALAVRLLPVPAARAGGLRLLSSDSYGHLRRSAAVAARFPHVPVWDPFLNHPDGAVWIWPPLFDLLVGGTARGLFGHGVSQDEVQEVLAALPPILGALHVVPLFLLARTALGRRRARFAALAYALLPSAALWSLYGHGDHHVAEALVLLAFLWLAARASTAPPGQRTGAAVIAGLALGAAVLTWQGAIFIAALAVPWTLLALGSSGAALGATATAVAWAGTALSLEGQKVPFSFVSFGWFQPLFLAAATVPAALLATFRAPGRRGRLAAAFLSIGLLCLVLPNAGRLAGAATRGSAYLASRSAAAGDDVADGGYLSYPREILSLISELQPLLRPPLGPAVLDAARDLSPGLLLLPFATLAWAAPLLRWRLPVGRGTPRLLLAVFGGALLVMTLAQRRNVYYLGIFTALALAEAIARVRPAHRLARGFAPLLGAALLVLLPGLAPLLSMRRYDRAPGPDFIGLLRRLGETDGPAFEPGAAPPAPGEIAGVMAPWAMGHFVTALTHRPAAADPNAYGFRRQCRLFTTPDDGEAEAILRGARCRYLVTTDLDAVLPLYASAAGRAGIPVGSTFGHRVHASDELHPVPFLTRIASSRTAVRLPDGRLQPRFRVFRLEGVAGP